PRPRVVGERGQCKEPIMANGYRGEIDVVLGGKIRTLCLTLGALAELEQAFGAPDLVALTKRFEEGRFGAHDLIKIIGCGLRGAGEVISDDDVGALAAPDGLQGYIQIVSDLFAQTFGSIGSVTANP